MSCSEPDIPFINFIAFLDCLYCFSKLLTSCGCVPEPAAILEILDESSNSGSSNSDFVGIMANLSSMKVPTNLKIDDGNAPKRILSENVDLDLLKELGAGTYEGDKYKEAVAKWFNTNIDTNLNYKTYSLEYKLLLL